MKSFFIFPLSLLLGVGAHAQTDSSRFAKFSKTIQAERDSVKFERISDFAFDEIDAANYSDADKAMNAMDGLAEKAKSKILEGRTLLTRAYLQYRQTNSSMAIAYYQKAQILFHQAGDIHREIRSLQRILAVYVALNDTKLARQYAERAIQLARENKLADEIAHIYTDFATIEDIEKNFEKALDYNDEAIRIYKTLGADYSATLFNRAIILKNAGKYEESVKIYKESLAFARNNKDGYMEEMVYINMPNTLLRMGRFDEAEMYLNKAREIAKTSPQRTQRFMHIYETFTEIYERRKEFDKAFAYQKKWIAYKDSVFNEEKSRQLIDTETKYRTRETEQQNLQLDKENVAKKRQLRWSYGGVGMLVLLLVVMIRQYVVIRRNSLTLSRFNGELTEANQQISQQSSQLKELMQELHHRVKNNLAIVSSLLYLQSSRLTDAGAIRAIEEAQQRVDTMSLIHKQLYQTENVDGVSMREYIGDLATRLTQSFAVEKLVLKTDIAPLILDLRIAVPLGLIINELATNAFKHAFDHHPEPILTIRLWKDDHMYLEVGDNGPGMDPDLWSQKVTSSFGKRLVNSLVKQLGGKLRVSTDNGTKFLLEISDSAI